MNILYIAFSCNPYNGSEDKIGWSIPLESAKSNSVDVITRLDLKPYIEKYLSQNPQPNLTFHYINLPKIYTKILNGPIYSLRMLVLNNRAYPLAKKICAEKNIDVIHQITPIEFRAVGKYGKIKNTKFVCGPLGGAEYIPDGLKSYAAVGAKTEKFRKNVNSFFLFNQKLSHRFNTCDFVLFANDETKDYLKPCKIKCKTAVCTEIGLGDNELSTPSIHNGKRVFLVAGRTIYRKGHDFLLDALEQLNSNYDYECRIVGTGDLLEHLKQRVNNTPKLKKHITFTGRIAYTQMQNEYKNADVFIMPSIRETTGTVLLEAISKGIPVITINKFGGRVILDNNTAWLIDGSDKQSYIKSLKSAIEQCINSPDSVSAKGKAARFKAEQFTWEQKINYYNSIYLQILGDEYE